MDIIYLLYETYVDEEGYNVYIPERFFKNKENAEKECEKLNSALSDYSREFVSYVVRPGKLED